MPRVAYHMDLLMRILNTLSISDELNFLHKTYQSNGKKLKKDGFKDNIVLLVM